MCPTLDDFFKRTFESGEWFPRVKYDPASVSRCPFGAIDSRGMVQWRPVERADDTKHDVLDLLHFQFVGEAIDFRYSHWSSSIDCRFGYEYLTLDCGAWNEADLGAKELQLREHLLACTERQAPMTMPLGRSSTDESCHFVMDLANGDVCITNPAASKLEKVADSLTDFLSGVQPVPQTGDLILEYFD